MLRGSSFEEVSAPSYWPWTQVLRTILQSTEHLSALPASARAATSVLGLIPELRAELRSRLSQHTIAEGDDPVASKAEPDLRAFRLFDAIATILKGMAARTPLVLVLDDLHSVDRDSLLLLKFVAREIRNHRIFAIGIYRKPETNKSSRSLELLDAIAREGTLLPLFGLQESETAEFVQAVTGEPPNTDFLKSCSIVPRETRSFSRRLYKAFAVEEQYKPGFRRSQDYGRKRSGIIVHEPARDLLRSRG